MDGLEGQEVPGDEAGLLRTESDGRIVKASQRAMTEAIAKLSRDMELMKCMVTGVAGRHCS